MATQLTNQTNKTRESTASKSHVNAFTTQMEWPTLCLFAAVYALWITLTAMHSQLPLLLVLIVLAYLVALHSSLQHEVIHGHPTPSPLVNALLAFPTLGLFVPYERYELLHLQHHRNWLLTDPYDDSESYFLASKKWDTLPRPVRAVYRFNNTLFGRLLIGPAIMLIKMCANDWQLGQHQAEVRRSWLLHFLSCGLVISWLLVCDFSILMYLFLIAYPATSLLMLRAYSEHLPEQNVEHRSAIIKSTAIMQLLFLNNNYHRVHHDHPEVPWYQLPGLYRQHYANQTTHVYAGYFELFRRFAFKSRFTVEHPFLARDKND